MNIKFSEQQQRIIASGITVLWGLVIAAAVLTVFILCVQFFRAFDHVFLPLAVAGICTMLVEPWYQWLRDKAGFPVIAALATVFLSMLIPIFAVIGMFGTLILVQLADLLDQIPLLWSKAEQWLQSHRPEIEKFFSDSGVGKKIRETVEAPGGALAQVSEYMMNRVVSAGSGIAAGVVALLGWAVLPVYLVLFLILPTIRPQEMKPSSFPFLKNNTAEDLIYLIREFVNLVVLFFRGQIIIALIQGTLYAIGFSLAGLEYGLVLGITLGFLNIIPYLGSALGLAVCLPLAWFQDGGGLTLLLLVIGVFTVVQLIESYYLTPKIMGDKTGLNPLVIIVAIFFWGSALGGILGMILAIPLTAFLVVLWRLAREKYIAQLF